MRLFIICLVICMALAVSPRSSLAQETHTIEVSDDLIGTITRQHPNEVFSPGRISVLNKKTREELIRVDSDELTLTLHDGKAIANIKQLPYGEQSAIIYEDFNFDGIKDIAIMDGQNSCYHGPSYVVYLGNKSGQRKFDYSEDFTRLAHEYCGMFQVDAHSRTIRTMTKSGCCWHQFSTFQIRNNKPIVVESYEDDSINAPFRIETSYKLVRNRMTKREEIRFEPGDNFSPVFAFSLEKKPNRVMIFNPCCQLLVYSMLGEGDERVEFVYPGPLYFNNEYSEKNPFEFKTSGSTRELRFNNASADYVVYFDAKTSRVGVRVTTGGKTFDLKGEPDSVIGDLNLAADEFRNVVVRQGPPSK